MFEGCFCRFEFCRGFHVSFLESVSLYICWLRLGVHLCFQDALVPFLCAVCLWLLPQRPPQRWQRDRLQCAWVGRSGGFSSSLAKAPPAPMDSAAPLDSPKLSTGCTLAGSLLCPMCYLSMPTPTLAPLPVALFPWLCSGLACICLLSFGDSPISDLLRNCLLQIFIVLKAFLGIGIKGRGRSAPSQLPWSNQPSLVFRYESEGCFWYLRYLKRSAFLVRDVPLLWLKGSLLAQRNFFYYDNSLFHNGTWFNRHMVAGGGAGETEFWTVSNAMSSSRADTNWMVTFQISHLEALTPSVMYYKAGLWEVSRVRWEPLLALSPHHVAPNEKGAICRPARGLSPEPDHAGTLISDFWPPKLEK